MAHLGVLKAGMLVAVLGLLQTGCTIGPIWAREYRGKVVDEETQAPVENMEVFISPMVVGLGAFGGRGVEATRWGTTDAKGEFVLDGEFEVWFAPLTAMGDPPFVTFYHPDYGVLVKAGLRRDGLGTDRFPSEGEAFQLGRASNWNLERYHKCWWGELCDHITSEACSHLKKVIRERDPGLACAQVHSEGEGSP